MTIHPPFLPPGVVSSAPAPQDDAEREQRLRDDVEDCRRAVAGGWNPALFSHEEVALLLARVDDLTEALREARKDGERLDWIEVDGLPDAKEYDGCSLRQAVDALRRSEVR